MPEHKHLKQRVRERMASTGETYSTARRRVLARARQGRLPAGLVPRYHTFGVTNHQASSLVARLLTQAGHLAPHTGRPYSEAMVCGLGGGIGFLYAVFEYADVPPLFTLVAQHHPEPWPPAVLGRLGIHHRQAHSSSPSASMAALRQNLAEGRAVWCTLARNGLPWHAGEPALPSDPYPVVVVGRAEGSVYVDDRDPAPQCLPDDAFAAAWSGHTKGRHHRLTIDPAAASRPPSVTDLATAVRSAIETTVAHLTGPVLGTAYDVNFGLSGMHRFATQLRDGRTRTGWSRRFAEPGAFAWAMRRLHQGLELELTGPAATRPLYAEFLDESAPLLPEGGHAEASALFRQSAAVWSRLADRAAEIADELGEVTELAEQGIALVMARGRADAARIRDLTAQIAALQPPPPDPDVLSEFADLVQAARSIEEQAVARLREDLGPPSA
jgi:hypothetical protein